METTRGVPLEFSPFCNPLSLTPVASRTLMTKSWYCQELYKRSFLMQTAKVRITSPYRSSARWTESRNPINFSHVERTRGGDKEKGFQKGRTLRGGHQPTSCGSPLLSAAAKPLPPEEVSIYQKSGYKEKIPNQLFHFNSLRHTSLVFLLWWVKRWKPLSLTPPWQAGL